MRSIPILIVSMGLFLACTSKPDRPRLEVPDAAPMPTAATCQESCDSNDDCGAAVTDPDGGIVTPAGFCCLGDNCGAKNRCVECLASSDCATGSVCLSGSCVGCATDKDCSGDTPLCNILVDGAPIAGSAPLNTCVECKADDECAAGQRCSTYGKCSCTGPGQCTEPGMRLCRDEGCVCSDDSACPTGAKKCLPGTGICLVCAEDDDCTGDLTKCFAPGTVGAYCGCRNNDQCADGTLCQKDSGKCVACLTNDDCAGSATGSVCTASGTCGQCAQDSDCGTGTCNAGICECKDASDCKSVNTMPELKWVCE
jgi:Cys-rich repeat protein